MPYVVRVFRIHLVTMAILMWAGGAASVRAGNDDSLLLGNEAAMTAGAVAATIADGSALWYNPAGLAALYRDQVDVTASVFLLRHFTVRDFVVSSDGMSSDTNVSEFVSVPSALTYTRPIGRHTNLGFGVFVPEMIDVTLRGGFADDFSGTPSEVRLLATVESSDYHVTVGLGHEFSPRLRIGGGLIVNYRSRQTSVHFGSGYDSEDRMVAVGLSSLSSDQFVGGQLSAGVQWEFMPHWTLGLSARSPGLAILNGSKSYEYRAIGVVTPGDSGAAFESEENDGLRFETGMYAPARIRLGVAFRGETGYLSAEGDVQHAVRSSRFEVDRDFVWNARLGGRYRMTDTLSVGGGFFTDRTSVPKGATDFRADLYGVAVGFELSNAHKLDQNERAKDIVFSTTVAIRAAYGSGSTLQLAIDPSFENDVGISGDAQFDVYELGLHIGSALLF